jgi:hypothetical protein
MAEEQIAQTFSDQVDGLLAGQAGPGDDPLLSLAVEMAPGPALDPSPTFARRLRRELLASAPPKRSFKLRRWSLAGATLSALVALALLLVWTPTTLSAAEVLARAAGAVAAEPGQIEYLVLKVDVTDVDKDPRSDGGGLENTIVELWNHIDVASDGRIAVVEFASTAYQASDTALEHPLWKGYQTPDQACAHVLDAPLPYVPDLEDCITFDPDSGGPGAAARYASESLQNWIARMQASDAEIEFQEGEFNDRPVYSLTYLEVSQNVIVSSESPEGPGVVSAAYTDVSTVTLYVDRETYLPVGRIHHSTYPDGRSVSYTQTVLQYQVLEPAELDFDPFAWPPER